MGFFSRLFNWRGMAEAMVTEAVRTAAAAVKLEIDEDDWTDEEKMSLKNGVDLLAEKVLSEVRERLY